MRLTFFNRTHEIEKLTSHLNASAPAFMVLYGRRRCGKSTLLQKIARPDDIYFLADQQETSLQIKALAREIGRHIPGFAQAIYPTWENLFNLLQERARPGTALLLDEFPYLVQKSAELPSIIQKMLDNSANKIHLLICGSSQRMMQGLVLDSTAPLYGRAVEIIKVRPLAAGWITDALALDPVSAIEAYSLWGGVPRYWELVRQFADQETACKELALDRDGILHDEPMRLLLDDISGAYQPHSLLALIAGGAHRLSEIAARLGKPATHLSRPLANLIQLGYLKRELPFGENLKSSKRTLYKLNDPFLQFWYRIVLPNRSLLEQDLVEEVYQDAKTQITAHTANVWEELARRSVPHLEIAGRKWKPAARWWGKGRDGKQLKIDVVAESFDGRAILLGEAKWEEKMNLARVMNKLKKQAANFHRINNREVVLAAWCKYAVPNNKTAIAFEPQDVLAALKK
jgi:AAA+ ATPase superfamily predicted ATPase